MIYYWSYNLCDVGRHYCMAHFPWNTHKRLSVAHMWVRYGCLLWVKIDQGPISLMVFHHNSNSMEFLFCSLLHSCSMIDAKFSVYTRGVLSWNVQNFIHSDMMAIKVIKAKQFYFEFELQCIKNICEICLWCTSDIIINRVFLLYYSSIKWYPIRAGPCHFTGHSPAGSKACPG